MTALVVQGSVYAAGQDATGTTGAPEVHISRRIQISGSKAS